MADPIDLLFVDRLARVRAAMADDDVDVLLLSVGPDLPWLCGYEAMPLERLTMFVVPVDGDATLLVPRVEAPRVVERASVFALRPWDETEDPLALVHQLTGPAEVAAVGDHMWSRFLVGLLQLLPDTSFVSASRLMGPLRAVKDEAEVAALALASAAADRVATQLQEGAIILVGRTEAEVSNEIGQRLLDEGHRRVNFAIVASGPNAASPHHDPSTKRIEADEVVLCDFGGTFPGPGDVGYCSDITRCVWTGEPPEAFLALYTVLEAAQGAGVAAARVGARSEEVDAAARSIIEAAGYGEHFVHRTGHGIGVEAHEDPYIVTGNRTPLVAGNAFSVEPGIYVPGRWGARLEDIVVATETGPRALNVVDHHLIAL